MPLTPQDVVNKQFAKVRRGYDTTAVDDFLDEVEAELARLLAENHALNLRLAAIANREQAPEAPPAPQAQVAVVPPPPPAPVAPVAPAAVVEAGESEQAALRTLLLAQRAADQAIAEAEREADRLLTEARTRAGRVDAEINARTTNALAEIEGRRQEVEARIEDLRAFEREYRLRLRAYLEAQLKDLENRGGGDEAGAGVPPAARSAAVGVLPAGVAAPPPTAPPAPPPTAPACGASYGACCGACCGASCPASGARRAGGAPDRAGKAGSGSARARSRARSRHTAGAAPGRALPPAAGGAGSAGDAARACGRSARDAGPRRSTRGVPGDQAHHGGWRPLRPPARGRSPAGRSVHASRTTAEPRPPRGRRLTDSALDHPGLLIGGWHGIATMPPADHRSPRSSASLARPQYAHELRNMSSTPLHQQEDPPRDRHQRGTCRRRPHPSGHRTRDRLARVRLRVHRGERPVLRLLADRGAPAPPRDGSRERGRAPLPLLRP